MFSKHLYILFSFAVLKKSYLSNVLLYLCQSALWKCRTKFVCWDSISLDLLYISCNTLSRYLFKNILSMGRKKKCKLTFSSGSHNKRECSDRDLPNFLLSVIRVILSLTAGLSSEINIRTPFFSRSKTSEIRGLLSFSSNKGYPWCLSCKSIKKDKIRNY